MGVVYLAYCGSWQLSLHESCFCAFYIFNTTPNPTSSSFFQNVFVLVILAIATKCANLMMKVYLFRHLYVPEVHHITGEYFIEREDEGHVFKIRYLSTSLISHWLICRE